VSKRKAVVERYFDGFRRSDHDQILACLTDDIVWDIAGFTHLEGKDAYDNEIENPDFVGSPTLDVDRMVEEGDVVVALGTGASTQAGGAEFRFAFCDVFTFVGDLVSRRESYVVPLVPPDQP
jgi:ketosteroid isomerase-like protein